METAELLFNHVFKFFRIPEDIVSDWGPQFISKMLKVFFTLLGVTVSQTPAPVERADGEKDLGDWTFPTATRTLGTSS